MVVCPKCGGTEADTDPSRGQSVCVTCGFVLEANAIVSEVSFVEASNGASSVVGQFVPATGPKSFGPSNNYSQFTKESREVTLSNGRQKIIKIAHALKLSSHHIEAAQRFFMLAVQHNFIQGRKTTNVVAACLYIVCRREKTPHMLIDFSDVLATNVYILGNTFLKLSRLLNLQLPLIDPSLYIRRFASRLEFGDKTHAVSTCALRIVARMKRDWIQTGRRPSGLCGAGLLIAARLQGFRRTQKEIINVVRICDVTLRKRLAEFESTPTSSLTVPEFEAGAELEGECDPPAFTRAQKAREEKAKAALKSAADNPGVAGGTAEAALEAEMTRTLESSELQRIENEFRQGRVASTADVLPDATAAAAPRQVVSIAMMAGRSPAELAAAALAPRQTPETSRDQDEDDDDNLSDIDDDEVNGYLLREEEVQIKTAIWYDMNQDYLAEQAEKQRLEEQTRKLGLPTKSDARRRKRKRGDSGDGNEEDDAGQGKTISSKLNYDAIRTLFPEQQIPEAAAAATSSTTTTTADAAATATAAGAGEEAGAAAAVAVDTAVAGGAAKQRRVTFAASVGEMQAVETVGEDAADPGDAGDSVSADRPAVGAPAATEAAIGTVDTTAAIATEATTAAATTTIAGAATTAPIPAGTGAGVRDTGDADANDDNAGDDEDDEDDEDDDDEEEEGQSARSALGYTHADDEDEDEF